MSTVLSEFLTAGLLPIGEDDQKLSLLEDAAADLAGQIKARPSLAARIGLVGLDSRTSNDDPVHTLVSAAIRARWQTLNNKVGPNPVQIHRAVLLRSLELVAEENIHIAAAVPLMFRHQVREDDSAGKALRSLLERFREKATEQLLADWVRIDEPLLPKLQSKARKLTFNKEEFSLSVQRAIAPTDKEGKPLPNANPHHANAGQPWSLEFSPRIIEAIWSALQGVHSSLRDEANESQRELSNHLQELLRRAATRDAKAELLWIRMSQYSPSAGADYPSLEPIQRAIHAAIDISGAVVSAAPPSVESFLITLVRELGDAEVDLIDFLKAIQQTLSPRTTEFTAFDGGGLAATGRRAWIEVALNSGKIQAADTGENEAIKLKTSSLSLQLFRELQVARLLTRQ